MAMRKGAGGVLFTAAAVAATIMLAAAPALASTVLTVKITGGGTYKATSSHTVLVDHGVSVTCKSSVATGAIPSGTHKGTAPVTEGTAKTLAFTGCSGILGPVTTKALKTPYLVKANSVTNAKGQTDVVITGVDVTVSMSGCSFVVTGSAPGFYTNGTHTLTMKPTLPIKPLTAAGLKVSGVKGCAGVVKNGDHPTYTSIYKLSRAIVIKST